MKSWYNDIKQAEKNWDWDQFGKGLLVTLGIAASALIISQYYNITPEQATTIIEQDPKQAEAILQEISPQLPQQIQQQPQQPQKTEPKPNNQIISFDEMLNFIAKNENYEPYSYQDTPTNKSIGYGFNLNRKDARNLIENLGYNFDNIISGNEPINKIDATYLLRYTVEEAFKIAEDFSGGLNNHPINAQKALIDMSYNLGRPRLFGFTNLRQAILEKDYQKAAEEMKNSRWHQEKQVGNRSNMLINLMMSTKN